MLQKSSPFAIETTPNLKTFFSFSLSLIQYFTLRSTFLTTPMNFPSSSTDGQRNGKGESAFPWNAY